jgi:hypothetical protein
MSKTNRVENEVAIISLASAALADFVPQIVPSLYGWGSAATESSQGWMIQELMPGAPLDESFDAMDIEIKRPLLARMVEILKKLQDFKLPKSITGFGGLTFDNEGNIISAAMPTNEAGPWESYEDCFREQLDIALQKAEINPHIKGWHAKGVRERLNAFIEGAVPAHFASLDSQEERVITHAISVSARYL